MSRYASLSVHALLDAFASNQPVPGGGSAAALTAAVGTSLLIMVATLPRSRQGAPDERAALDAAAARLRPLRDQLIDLVDRDSHAYTMVLDAFRLPRTNEQEISVRTAAIAAAMRDATEAPLDTMRTCRDVLRDAPTIAGCGSRAAGSDVGVAIELLAAAVRGAAMNVDTNLESMKDQKYVVHAAQERDTLTRSIHGDVERARSALSAWADGAGQARG